MMARTRYCGGGARGHGRDDVVLVPVPRHQRNISVPVHAWLTLEGPWGQEQWRLQVTSTSRWLAQQGQRSEFNQWQSPKQSLHVSSLNLPSRVPGLLYYRGLQLPCLESQHLTLDFFLLSFLILYFISQLCPEFLYFSLYSCQCFWLCLQATNYWSIALIYFSMYLPCFDCTLRQSTTFAVLLSWLTLQFV